MHRAAAVQKIESARAGDCVMTEVGFALLCFALLCFASLHAPAIWAGHSYLKRAVRIAVSEIMSSCNKFFYCLDG